MNSPRGRRVGPALLLVIACFNQWAHAGTETPEILVLGEIGALGAGQKIDHPFEATRASQLD